MNVSPRCDRLVLHPLSLTSPTPTPITSPSTAPQKHTLLVLKNPQLRRNFRIEIKTPFTTVLTGLSLVTRLNLRISLHDAYPDRTPFTTTSISISPSSPHDLNHQKRSLADSLDIRASSFSGSLVPLKTSITFHSTGALINAAFSCLIKLRAFNAFQRPLQSSI